jgi:glycosyltransferase involved in cell wall biosynthesis
MRLNPKVNKYIRETLPKFNRITAVSDSIKTEFLTLGIPPNKIDSIPNGANVSKIISLKVNVDNIRRKYGIPINKFFILSIGRNIPIKGYQYIPSIIKYLLESRKDFIWILVGKDTDSIKKTAEENGVGSYLKSFQEIGINKESITGSNDYLFPSKDIIEIYKAADLLVFPSLMESFGMVLLEAMAAGLPIVTSDAPGCRDLVKHEINGLISPAGDTYSMSYNILRLLEDDVLMKNIKRNGLNKSKLYEWKNIADKYLKVYSKIIENCWK